MTPNDAGKNGFRRAKPFRLSISPTVLLNLETWRTRLHHYVELSVLSCFTASTEGCRLEQAPHEQLHAW